jgi:hypothetical protein
MAPNDNPGAALGCLSDALCHEATESFLVEEVGKYAQVRGRQCGFRAEVKAKCRDGR